MCAYTCLCEDVSVGERERVGLCVRIGVGVHVFAYAKRGMILMGTADGVGRSLHDNIGAQQGTSRGRLALVYINIYSYLSIHIHTHTQRRCDDSLPC